MVDAASGNPLVNRVGLVAPWLQNHELVEAVYGGPEGVGSLKRAYHEEPVAPPEIAENDR